jgi:hypothetical protein
MSAQFCGCDPECQPRPHYCERHAHQLIQNLQGRDMTGPPYATELALPPVPTPAPDYKPIPETFIFGFGHKACHGKDSAAQHLIESFPAYVKRFAFADALRCYCRVEYGMTTKDAPLLQRVGIEMRAKKPTVWIDAVYWQLVENAPPVAIITDVRFENEANFVKALGGVLVRLERLNREDGMLYQATDRDPNHISETALNDYPWDHTIQAFDVDELKVRVRSYFRTVIMAKTLGL